MDTKLPVTITPDPDAPSYQATPDSEYRVKFAFRVGEQRSCERLCRRAQPVRPAKRGCEVGEVA
jgi:hypothetical protein